MKKANLLLMALFFFTLVPMLSITSGGVISDRLTGEGTGDGEFYYPHDTIGFSQATSEYILVCNTLNNRIEVFNLDDDTFQNTFGSP